MTGWRFEAVIDKELEDLPDDVLKAAATGATRAADKVVRIGKDRLRADTRAGFRDGDRLANTWRGVRYPNRRGEISMDAAAVLWSSAPELAEAFEEPATITVKSSGAYICIPTAAAPKPPLGRGSNRRNWIAAARRAYPKMEFIPIQRGRLGLLAVKRPGGRGRDRLLVLFNCVRSATLRKRMNYAQIFADLERLWPEVYQAEIDAALKDAGF